MKKFIKLIALLVVLGLLIAGYFMYDAYLKKQEEDDGEQTEDKTVDVLSIDSNTIVEINYNVLDEQVALKKVENMWQWASDSDFPLDQSYIESMLVSLSDIVAKRLIADSLSNESDFGLDNPECVVNFATADGNSYVYTIGNFNSVSKGYYFKLSTNDKVYIADEGALDAFAYTVMEMVNVESMPTFKAEDVKAVDYSVNGNNFAMTTDSSGANFYSKPYTFFYKAGIGETVPVDAQAGASFMSAVANLSIVKAVAFKPAELSAYGLDENSRLKLDVAYTKSTESDSEDTSVTVKTDENYSVYIGKYTDEEGQEAYCAMFDGSYVIYELSGGDDFYKAMNAEMQSKLVCPVLADDIVSIKAEVGTNVYFYNIEDIEANDKLTSILNSITSITYSGVALAEHGEQVFKVTFDVGDRELVLNAYRYQGENYIAAFDTFYNLVVPVEKIENIIKSLKEV